jgi:hypothetical protein
LYGKWDICWASIIPGLKKIRQEDREYLVNLDYMVSLGQPELQSKILSYKTKTKGGREGGREGEREEGRKEGKGIPLLQSSHGLQ